MPGYKRKNTSGKIVWFYKFRPPGASRHVLPIREFGFATKQAAVDAEVVRRIQRLDVGRLSVYAMLEQEDLWHPDGPSTGTGFHPDIEVTV